MAADGVMAEAPKFVGGPRDGQGAAFFAGAPNVVFAVTKGRWVIDEAGRVLEAPEHDRSQVYALGADGDYHYQGERRGAWPKAPTP